MREVRKEIPFGTAPVDSDVISHDSSSIKLSNCMDICDNVHYEVQDMSLKPIKKLGYDPPFFHPPLL